MKRRYVVLSLAVVLALALAVPAFGGPTNIVSALTNVKKTANKALKQAKAASAAAAAAQSTANTAVSDAAAAEKAAKAAQTTANGAQTTANTALSTANGAKTEAAAAKTAATAAKAAADAAQATANSKFGSTFTETGANSGTRTTSGNSNANCPAGSDLTGGGYTTAGAGANEVVPTYNGPYGSAWFAVLERIPAGANTWSVTAFAQCAQP